MKSIWSGAISFGLVNIPVKIYPATHDSRLDLDMLDSRDSANIKFKRVNENTGKEVPYKSIKKGYLYNERYVILEDKDFKSADTKKTQLIEILHFVTENEIDSIYYEQPYYLEPEKSGLKAYGILRDALADSEKVGITSFVSEIKEKLAILKPHEKVIVLNVIRFEEEILDYSHLNLPALSKAKGKEQIMADKLINQLTEGFDISKYKDTYTAKLLNIIKQKAKKGNKYKAPVLKVVHRKPEEDLMSMLKASLENGRRKAS